MNADQASLWVQLDPEKKHEFLTCAGVSGTTLPKRSQATVYCPGVAAGSFEADDFVPGDITEPTMNMSRKLEHVFNFLVEQDCRMNMRQNFFCGGETPVIYNYRIAFLLLQAITESANVETSTVVNPGDNARINTTGTLKGLKAAWLKQLAGERQGIDATTAVNDLAFLPGQCYSKCTRYRNVGQVGYAVLDTDYVGVYGDTVLKTVDYGANWDPTPQSPFNTLGRNATRVLTVPLANNEHRVIVFGGAMPATYPEIGYSEGTRATGGNTWTDVQIVAAGGGRGINDVDRDTLGRIWAALDDGRIFLSEDLVSTWSESEGGGETGEDVNGIAFYDANIGYAVCDSNVVLKTTDGGNTWAAINGPESGRNLLSVEVNYLGHVLVGTNAGDIYISFDECVSFEANPVLNMAAGSIDRIENDPHLRYVVYAAYNNAAPSGTLYRSEDGGISWRPMAMTGITDNGVNNGFYGLCVPDLNTVFIGGEVVGGTGLIGRFIRRV